MVELHGYGPKQERRKKNEAESEQRGKALER
jgi:hypothetical protein